MTPYGPEMDENWWDRSKKNRATRIRGEKNQKNWPKVQKSPKNSPSKNRKGSIRDRPPHIFWICFEYFMDPRNPDLKRARSIIILAGPLGWNTQRIHPTYYKNTWGGRSFLEPSRFLPGEFFQHFRTFGPCFWCFSPRIRVALIFGLLSHQFSSISCP